MTSFLLIRALAHWGYPSDNIRRVAKVLIVATLFLGYGCGDDANTLVVDFSKAVAVERPHERLPETPRIRVAVGAMISPKETFIYYRQLLDYIGKNLGLDAQLIQRKTYSEINELFGKGEIDLAFVCSGPYANGKEKYGFQLLATPQVHGSHFYQSYLLVNEDSPYHSLENLKGMVFAFTDPDSNTGKLVPTYWLRRIGERPETFFKKTLYTYSHDNSILAVARGLVDGAAVDGLIWEYYHHKNPIFTSRTRIIRKSDPYGTPPLVTSTHLSPELKDRIRKLVLSMHLDPEGRTILKELMIDRFTAPQEAWYAGIRKMVRELTMVEKETHAISKPQD
jgi:phosphonate transport system substrate-binding protein